MVKTGVSRLSCNPPLARWCRLLRLTLRTFQLSVACDGPSSRGHLGPSAAGQAAGVLRGDSLGPGTLILNSPAIVEMLSPKQVKLWKQKSKPFPWEQRGGKAKYLNGRNYPGESGDSESRHTPCRLPLTLGKQHPWMALSQGSSSLWLQPRGPEEEKNAHHYDREL